MPDPEYNVSLNPDPQINVQLDVTESDVPGPRGPAGPPGAASTIPGPQGEAGIPGSIGPTGPAGEIGDVGEQGPPGVAGTAGAAGAPGIQGIQGEPGATGDTGPTGAASTVPGPQGIAGPAGAASTVPGPTGPAGAASTVPGPTGPQGSPGATGGVGPVGPAGSPGTQGIQGPTGPAGAASTVPGPTGPTGPASTVPGPQGIPGTAGTAGAQGIQGVAGTPGSAGATGPSGPSAVSANANNKAVLGSDSLILVQGTASGVGATTHAQTVSGDDPQLSNARTPTAHHATHEHGGSDAVAITYADVISKPASFAPSAHAASHASAGSDPLTLVKAQISDFPTIPAADGTTITNTSGTISVGAIPESKVTNLATDLGTHTTNIAANTSAIAALGTASTKNVPASGNAAAGEVVYGSDTRLSDARALSGSIAESAVTNLVTDLAAKAPSSRLINTGSGLTGGGDLTADRTLAVAIDGVTLQFTTPVANYVQSNNNYTPASQTTNVTPFSSNVTAGNLLLLSLDLPAAFAGTIAIADTRGSTWTQVGVKYSQLGGALYVFCALAASSGANTVTATFGSAVAGAAGVVLEYAGVTNVTDGEVDSTATSATVTSGSLTTTNANDLLVWFYGNNTTLTALSGGAVQRIYNVTDGDGAADVIVSSVGTYQLTGTQSSGGYFTRLIAFKLSPSTPKLAVLAIPESAVNNLPTDLGLKALKATIITAGDGMTGGGDLSANRTLAVDGTVVRSTDVRMAAAWQRYNAIRNPEMLIAQRGTSIAAIANGAYGLDGWTANFVGTMAATVTQNAAAIPADSNNWFPYTPYAHRVTFTTGQAILSAGHAFSVSQKVEGLLAEQLKSNPSSISLLVRSNITGTFTVSLRDSVTGYSCVNTGVISSANTWTRIAIPNIPAFSGSGTFPDGTGACYQLSICMGSGATFLTSTIGTWVAGNFVAATGQTNFAATTSNTFDFSLVQHEPNPVCTPYIKRELAAEWALSQRYMMYLPAVYIGYAQTAANTSSMGLITFPAMRVPPAISAGSSFLSGGPPVILGTASMNALNICNNTGSNWTVGASQQFTGYLTAEL